MVVHLGVVLVAVGFAASHSFAHQSNLTMQQGQTEYFDGHSFTYLGTREVATSTHTGLQALVRVDGGQTYGPAVEDYPFASEPIGTPSVKSTAEEDVYLTLASTPSKPGGAAVIGVIVEPLVTWIWIGGGVMLGGCVLAVCPVRPRRRDQIGDGDRYGVTSGGDDGEDGAVVSPDAIGDGEREAALPVGSARSVP
jgi:cytochrome c-type biogenesis protein CcmF